MMLYLPSHSFIVFIFFIFSIQFDIVKSQVPINKPIISFCIGSQHSCAVFDTKQMKCWGLMFSWGLTNTAGFLGDVISELGDSIPFINVGTGIGVVKASCGSYRVCMQLDTGNMKCLGSNGYGQTGIGLPTSTNPIGAWNGYIGNNLPNVNLGSGLKVLNIALGNEHSCVLVTGNKVKCYGWNYYGQLGYGDKVSRGESALQMGSNLAFVDLGTNVMVASIHSGFIFSYNCVILSAPVASAQRIKCWGNNDAYILGYGDTNNRGDISGEMGDNLPLVDLGTESRVNQITLGGTHVCALLVNDALKCWGQGVYGQLASGSYDDISSTGNSVPFVQIDSGKTIKYVAAGRRHTCIVYDDATTMKCIGHNGSAQLGQGDTVYRGTSPSSMIPFIPKIELGTDVSNISSIYPGEIITCVAFIDGGLKCFGSHIYGILATGATELVGDGPNEMGNYLKYAILFSPTKSPTKAPTLVQTKTPTMDPTIPTQSPTFTPSQAPTSNPTKSPTRKCDYSSAKLCKYDVNCMWTKINGVKKCEWFDCAILNQGKCGKERKRCRWNKTTRICYPKTK